MTGSHLKGKSEHQKKIFFLTNEMNHTGGKDIERKIYDIFQQLERKFKQEKYEMKNYDQMWRN